MRIGLAGVALSLGLLAGCDLGGPPTLAGVPPERRVAFVAVYDATTPGGAPIQRIVVADVDDPTVFEVISRPDHVSVSPHLSPDGQQVLFGDQTIGPVSAVQYVRYDLRTGRSDTMGHVPPGGEVSRPILVGLGSPVVWEPDGGGFYFTNPQPPFSIKQDVLRFRFADGYFERVHDSGSYATTAIGLKGPDSLIVSSVSPEAPGWSSARPAGIFVMSRDGQSYRRAQNPSLSHRAENGHLVRGFTEPAASEERGLVAMIWVELNPSAASDYTISLAVAGLDESSFRSYELDSSYLYWHPRWGPSGTILFERQPRAANDWGLHQVMVLDLEAGSIRELADPAIYGAAGMRMPDAGGF